MIQAHPYRHIYTYLLLEVASSSFWTDIGYKKALKTSSYYERNKRYWLNHEDTNSNICNFIHICVLTGETHVKICDLRYQTDIG